VIELLRAGIERIWTNHRAPAIAVSVILVVVIVAAGLLVVAMPGGTAQATATPSATPSVIASPSSPYTSDSSSPLPSPSDTPGASETPGELVYSDLDGVLAPSNLAHRLPIAVMIDDNAVARPQSGFSSASIVYQAPADGGEDRYMLIFQEGTATDIGPARSARPYYVYWVAEYKAEFAHVGGDLASLQQVIPAMSGNIYNMDDLSGGSCAYHRIDTRAAPHNDYTNSAALISCAAKRNYPSTYQNLPTRPFVDDTPLAQLPATQTITIPYRTGTVGYKFDRTTDSYLRLVDGSLQSDPANNKQVVAGSVIVMYQALSYFDNSAIEPGHNSRPIVANVGSGKAVVFEEGKAINATWKKTSNTALTRFYDSSGKEIPLVRGEIFMQSVPIGTAVTVK
jgi:hypothetical protein